MCCEHACSKIVPDLERKFPPCIHIDVLKSSVETFDKEHEISPVTVDDHDYSPNRDGKNQPVR